MEPADQATRKKKGKLAKKARRFARPRPIRHFHAAGVQSQTDRRYVRLEIDPDVEGPGIDVAPIYIPIEEFTDKAAIVDRLVSSGEFVPFPRFIDHAISSALDVNKFEPCVLHERPGYTANRFAFRDGSSIAVGASDLPCRARLDVPVPGLDVATERDGEIVFAAGPGRSLEAGSTESFCHGLANLLAGQAILTFSLALGFVAPLLRWSSCHENFGFALVGPRSSEAAVASQLATSPFGKPDADGELERENDLDIHLRYGLPLANDHLLPLPELDRWFALLSPAQQFAGIRAIANAFNHSLESPAGIFPRTRIVMLATSTKPVADHCPDTDGANTLVGHQLFEIPLTEKSDKVDQSFPQGVRSNNELFRQVSNHLEKHHGAAGRVFVLGILKRGLSCEEDLRDELDRLVDDFVAAASIDPTDDIGIQIATKFGLVDAAARLAKEFGALPECLDTRDAVLACFRRHRGERSSISFEACLRQLIANASTVDLGKKGKPEKVSDASREHALAYVMHSANKTIVLIRDCDKYRAVSDWDNLCKQSEFRKLHRRGKERDSTKGDVRSRNMTYATLGKGRDKERVWRFELDNSDNVDS